jgi:hypothetical protein
MLSVIMLSVIMLSVVMLSVVMLSVIMLRVMAPVGYGVAKKSEKLQLTTVNCFIVRAMVKVIKLILIWKEKQ